MKYQNFTDQQLATHIQFLSRQINESNAASMHAQIKEARKEMAMRKEQRVDELSKGTLGSYIGAATRRVAGHRSDAKEGGFFKKQHMELANKHEKGITKAAKRLTREEVESVMETLPKSADAGDWISDFETSDAPQFQGKSKEKRRQMAIAAYMHNKEGYELDEGLLTFAEQKAEELQELSKSTLRNYTKSALHRNIKDTSKVDTNTSPDEIHRVFRRAGRIGQAQSKMRGMSEAATDDKNPTKHGAEKMGHLDGRGTDAAVKNKTGTSTFDKNPQLLGRNADVESGKQWMVSFVNGIPDCLVPGETENEVVARMRMIMTNPQLINQVSSVQHTSAPTQQKMPHIRALGESHTINGEEFEYLEDVCFFETAQIYMSAINAGADKQLIDDINTAIAEMAQGEPVTHMSWNEIASVCEAVGLSEEDIFTLGAYLKS